MKKHIILISLCCFAVLQLNATSNKYFAMNGMNLNMIAPSIHSGLNNPQYIGNMTSQNEGGKDEPTRIEKKNFSDISKIDMNHQYGNIIIRESGSKNIQVEIQYFDKKYEKPVSTLSTSNNTLTIKTTLTNTARTNYSNQQNFQNRNRTGAKINYIISLPRGCDLSVNLSYGNLKMDKHQGKFNANLSFCDFDIKTLSGSTLKTRYCNVKIEEVQDIQISSSYSDIQIKKAADMNVSGDYNNYTLGEIQSLASGQNVQPSQGTAARRTTATSRTNNSNSRSARVVTTSSRTPASLSNNDFKIGSVAMVNLDVRYGNISINNLLSAIQVKCTYTDIKINSTSSKLENIKINGSYTDIAIGLTSGLSASIAAQLNNGNINIAKKYKVTYTQSESTGVRTLKKGYIGDKTPSAEIEISNVYGDVNIK